MSERSLSDYLADLSDLSNEGASGSTFTVSKSGAIVKLFDYQVVEQGDAVAITPTREGIALFKTGIMQSVPMTLQCDEGSNAILAQLFGVSHVAGSHNLQAKGTITDIIERAKVAGNFILAGSEEEASATLRKAVHVPAKLLHDSKSLQDSIFDRPGLQITPTVSSCYIRDGNTVRPVVIKKPKGGQGDADSRLELAVEYACSQALQRAGMRAVKSSLVKSDDGKLALVMEDFRAKSFAVKEIGGKVVTSGKQYFQRPAFFSANALLMKSNRSTTETSVVEDACIIANNALSEPGDLLAMHAFNVLIGNTDMHGENAGVMREFDEAGKVATTAGPAFDVGMHLLTRPIGANGHDAALEGKVLRDLGPRDIAASVVLPHLRATTSSHGYTSAFAKAAVARELVGEILRNELLPQGLISQSDIDKIDSYLSRPLGTQGSEFKLLQPGDVGLRRNDLFVKGHANDQERTHANRGMKVGL